MPKLKTAGKKIKIVADTQQEKKLHLERNTRKVIRQSLVGRKYKDLTADEKTLLFQYVLYKEGIVDENGVVQG